MLFLSEKDVYTIKHNLIVRFSTPAAARSLFNKKLCHQFYALMYFLSVSSSVIISGSSSRLWQTIHIKSNNSLRNKQEATPQLYCTSDGTSGDVLCYLWRMLSMCIFAGQCVLPISSACPWCSDVLVVLISRGARYSLPSLICWEWSCCLSCANQGAYGEDDGGEVVRGTNSSGLYLDSQLSEGTGVLRDWEARCFQGQHWCISFNFISFSTWQCFLSELKVCEKLIGLCFWLLSPDRLIYLGLFWVFFFCLKRNMPTLCTVLTQQLNRSFPFFCYSLPWRNITDLLS